jgi:hypothetical protein
LGPVAEVFFGKKSDNFFEEENIKSSKDEGQSTQKDEIR